MKELTINQKVKVFYDSEWQEGTITEIGFKYVDVALTKWFGDVRKIKKEFIVVL